MVQFPVEAWCEVALGASERDNGGVVVEAIITSAAGAILAKARDRVVDAADAEIRERLEGDPAKRAVREALTHALRQLEAVHAGATAALFDEHFLTTSGAPLLARYLVAVERPRPDELAGEWSRQFAPQKGAVPDDIHAAASDFLVWFDEGLRSHDAIRPLLDSRAAEQTAQMVERIAHYETRAQRRAHVDPRPIYRRLAVEDFAGREWLQQDLALFLGTARSGCFVIEGEPGVGKSTFLAWLARERGYAQHFVRSGDGAAAALGNLAVQLAAEWDLDDAGPDLRPDEFESLLEQAADKRDVQHPGRRIVLVIDALNEASVPPAGNILGLPPTLPTGVFLIVSQQPFGDVPLNVSPRHVVRLASEDPRHREDLRGWLEASVERIDDAGKLNRIELHRLVQTVLDKTDASWLYARYVIDELASGDRALDSLDELPQGLWHYYFEQWRSRRVRNGERWTKVDRPSLTALAAAEEPISAQTIAAFADLTDVTAIGLALEDWGPFLRRDEEVRWRIRHDSLRNFIRGGAALNEPREEEARFAEDLVRWTRGAHERIVDLYVERWGGLDGGLTLLRDEVVRSLDGGYGPRNLSVHAAAIGRLDALLGDVDYLVAADADRLVGLLPWSAGETTRPLAEAYLRASEWMAGEWNEERASYLQLAARQVGADELAVDVASRDLAGTWTVPWARWRAESLHLVVARYHGPIETIALAQTDGGPRIFTAHRDGLRQWTTTPSHPAIEIVAGSYEDEVVGLAIGTTSSQWLLASVETERSDARVFIYDVTGEEAKRFPWEVRPTRWPNTAAAFAMLNADMVLAVGNGEGSVAIWSLDFAGGEELFVLAGHAAPVCALAASGSTIVSGAEDGTLCVWRLGVDGGTECLPTAVHAEHIWAIVTGHTHDGREVVVSAGSDDTVKLMFDPLADQPIVEELCQGFEIGRLCLVDRGDAVTILVTGGADEQIRIWDLATRSQSQTLTGHANTVTGVAAFAREDLSIVSGGLDGTIRLWHPDQPSRGMSDSAWLRAEILVGGPSAASAIVACRGQDGSLTVLDAGTGEYAPWDHEPATDWTTLAVARFAGTLVVLTGHTDGTVHLHETASGDEARAPLQVLDVPVTGLVISDDYRYLVATGAGNSRLSAWDLDAGGLIARRTPSECDSIAVGAVDGRPTALLLSRDEQDYYHPRMAARVLDLETGSENETASVELPAIFGHGLYNPWPQTAFGVWRAGGQWLAVHGVEDRNYGGGHGTWTIWHPDVPEPEVRNVSPLPTGPVTIRELHGSIAIIRANRYGTITLTDANDRDYISIQVGADVERLCVVGAGTIVASTSAGLIAIEIASWPPTTAATN